ncbi:MAG: beta-propeller fold lactonase family protein, partial [Gemmatimonadetes bacterium]|nr:beta-propeller fold lactonase family protein [Gemmatimonadota bacterium]
MKSTFILALVAVSLTACDDDRTGPDDRGGEVGAVYVMTNGAMVNGVAVFDRASNGTLMPIGTFPTGGMGTGSLLDSQGALILSPDGRLLFASNPGSDQITVFSVQPQGLTRVQTVSSNGDRPVSLTLHNNLLYVLNSGSEGNISGFTVGTDGRLTSLAGSTQPLSTSESMPCSAPPLRREEGARCNVVSPGQVQFNPQGTMLVVTERLRNQFSTYAVGTNGVAGGRRTQRIGGETPFGFAFDTRGRMFVSEAFEDRPGEGAASSYVVAASGDLSIVTRTLANRQTASCWLILTPDGRFAYISNPIAGTLTGYRIAEDASLTMLDADGSTGATGGDPRDMATSADGRYIYALNNGAASIGGFRVNENGGLTRLPVVG